MQRLIHFIASSLLLISTHTFAQNGIEKLSPELRALLSKEMLAIQDGMQAIIPAYAAGNWHEISHIALNIKNSYILKQSLSRSQMHELHSLLPDDFLQQDQQFHYAAGMLSHAADMEKPELVGFYFSELTKNCISCHSQFAQHKFPALAPKLSTHQH